MPHDSPNRNNGHSFVITAPGRVNLLGEHTDYNGLPVLPMAIERTIRIKGKPRLDRTVTALRDTNEAEKIEFSLESPIPKHSRGHWINYVKAGMQGILDELGDEDNNRLYGCDLHISGDIPKGVGLSSSSALVVASALALLHANHIPFERIQLAERMSQAEYYVGTRGGGMDQAACLLGQKDHLLKIDFFPLRVQVLPIPDAVTVVICDSLVYAKKTGNALQAYNLRAVECRFASMLLKEFLQRRGKPAHFQRLGDMLSPPWNYTYDDLLTLVRTALQDIYTFEEMCAAINDDEQIQAIMHDYSFRNTNAYENMVFACGKRYRHIVTDGMRVERSGTILKQGDFVKFGQLINEGHTSARNDFEISCPELDQLTESARENGALGSRLTGAGFGGCTVNLVESAHVDEFIHRMRDFYSGLSKPVITGEDPILVSPPAEGAKIAEI